MPDSQWDNLKEIFHAAVALPPPERASYLDKACDGDPSLRAAVESLLKSHEETGNFVEGPAYQAAADILVDGMELRAGETVGHYRIVSLLGEGGMGKVYLAEDTKLHRKVSLKFLSQSFTKDSQRLRRFELEARAVSALNHPNILTIHEIGEADGHRFIATEFIEGQTLRERLRSGLDTEDALEIAIQVASALVAAHRVNIVHRDIKPENIMIRKDDGLVKVLDFGLAKMTQRRQSGTPVDSRIATALIANTGPGVVIGTVTYMSPEQARGDTVDERTDIWSLGVVLYEMVAGCSPFAAGTSNEIISAILSKQVAPPLARYSQCVPERLEEIVEKALTKNRDERYQTSKDLLIDLKRLKQSLETKAAIERSTSPEQLAVASSGGQSNDIKSFPLEDTTSSTQSTSSAEYIVNQVKTHKSGAMVTLGVLLVVAGVVFYTWRVRQTAGSGQPAISSVAVLPFINVNSDPDTEYLSDGITDNIIERLSQLPNLKVMSHSAVFHYKGRETDVLGIGRELGVEAVLTGRLIKRNDAITINLELVNAQDNSHIWGDQYDHKLSDLFAVQREISLDVSDKLRLRLSGESKERLTRAYTGNAEAYQLYLKGRYSWEKWTLEGAKQAVEYFEEAIKKDPNYALAYAGLADVYIFGAAKGAGLPQKEGHRRAREAATKALSLDSQLGEAHAALAEVLLYDDWDFAGAEREFKQALELNPSYAEGHHEYSHLLLLLGRINESFAESKKFLELDPVSEAPIGHLAYHYMYARQYDEAIQQCQKDLQLYPESPQRFTLADAYYHKGMFREAVEEFLKAFAQDGLTPPDRIDEFRKAFAQSGMKGFYRQWIEQLKSRPQTEQDYVDIGELYARIGEKDQAFQWLEKAYDEHSDGLVRLKEELGFDNVRSDPRYVDLVRRIGLPQ
jgi:serine/threonine protein kinase/tetratricopeptide (TPR) repeat protein